MSVNSSHLDICCRNRWSLSCAETALHSIPLVGAISSTVQAYRTHRQIQALQATAAPVRLERAPLISPNAPQSDRPVIAPPGDHPLVVSKTHRIVMACLNSLVSVTGFATVRILQMYGVID
jgi:hypothetical protein